MQVMPRRASIASMGFLSVAVHGGCGVTAIRPKVTATSNAGELSKIPAFSLPSSLGGALAISDVTARSAAVLVFYRGFW
jgi:hypothetical protein